MRIVFMGTPAAAVPSLERLIRDGHQIPAVYTQPDRPSGRGNTITFSPVKEFALVNDLSVVQPLKLRTPEAIETLRSFDAEVAVVVAYGRILPVTFLEAFPLGAINVHFSLLPKYRGAAPVNWAIVNGETETGVTTMRMDVGLDTGDILLQRKTAIGTEETAIELMERLSFAGAELLSETVENVDRIEAVPQENERATLAPILNREDGLVHWVLSATEITDRIRGFQPFPSTFTRYQQARLTLWRGHPYEVRDDLILDRQFIPGQVLEASGERLLIGCGGGSVLAVDELQLEGKRRLPAREFLNGVRLSKGEVLGD